MKAAKYLYSGLLLVMTGLMACSPKVDFSENPAVGGLENPLPGDTSQGTQEPAEPVCRPGETTVAIPSKIIFVVDQSGSNVNSHVGGEPSDPNKSFRSKVMFDFFHKHSKKTHLSWSLLGFRGISAKAYVGTDTAPKFTASVSKMTAAFADFQGSADGDGTPYSAAFKMVSKLISKDIESATSNTQYLIAFITDGYPTDYCKGEENNVDCGNNVREDDLDRDVKKMVKIAQGRIQFSTVYYGPRDSQAADRLERMASIAGGQFVDLNKTDDIQLDDLLTIPKPICD